MKRTAFQKRMLRRALYAARCGEWLRPQTFAQCAALAQLHNDGLLYRRGDVGRFEYFPSDEVAELNLAS